MPWPNCFQPLDAIDQPSHVVDRPVGQRADRFDKLRFRAIGQLQAKRDFLAVEHVDERLAVAIGLLSCRGRKPPLHAMQHVQNVLARAERVRAKIGTRAERIAPLLAAQRHAIGLARKRAGDRVIGPRLLRIGRLQAELLGPCPLLAIAQGLFEQLLLVQGFDRPAFVGRGGQAQRRLLLQDQRNRRADVFANRLASRAIHSQPILGLGHRGDGRHDVFSSLSDAAQLQPEQIAAKIHVAVDVDVVVACAAANQLLPLRPQEFGGLHIREPGKAILEGEFLALLGLCLCE